MSKKATKTSLIRPQKHTKEYYDYNEISDYLEKKYNYQERDYAGKFKTNKDGKPTQCDETVPYLDFWHWVLDHHGIHNGCHITFSQYDLNEYKQDPDTASWVLEIYERYITEFADDKGELELYVWW